MQIAHFFGYFGTGILSLVAPFRRARDLWWPHDL
jgi:hypothetical protein